MKQLSPILFLPLFLAAVFSAATLLQPRVEEWTDNNGSASVLQVVFGDTRRLIADQFLEQADVSFHSGYYPSIFDQRKPLTDTAHMRTQEGSPEDEEHDRKMNFMGRPRDLFERFGRNFLVTEHTHLASGKEREILPWLRISAELDPHRVDTYTIAAYWLRNSLHKVDEAERFLRQGLLRNPNSYEIWYELGVLYDENRHDPARARNAWDLALKRWQEIEPGKKDPDKIGLEKIIVHLANVEERQGNLDRAIHYYEMALSTSPNPDVVKKHIEELQQKLQVNPTNGFKSADGKPAPAN